MGILNVTPDSFHDGGRYTSLQKAVDRAALMIEEGADIIDIGGESSRPGAEPVPVEVELERVVPVVEALSARFDIPLSVDTWKSDVAREALKAGAEIINDITALTGDKTMGPVAAEADATVVLMHMRGTPQTMQKDTSYENLVDEVYTALVDAAEGARGYGVHSSRIILDPGIGFGKSLEDNYRLLNNLRRFSEAGYPLLVGLSRKSMIGKLYDNEVDRLPGTVALNTLAVMNGAAIIRVHDVREHRLALDTLEMARKVS